VLIAILLAFVLGFIVGVRIVQSRPPQPPTPEARVFEPFVLPPPTLPPTCCLEDDSPEQPTRSAPGTVPPGAVDTADNGSGLPKRMVARTIRPHHQLAGKASWHATGRSGLYAAACRPLRRAMGADWRGRRVLVAYGRRAIEVTLNDLRQPPRRSTSRTAFRYFAPLSRGVLRVSGLVTLDQLIAAGSPSSASSRSCSWSGWLVEQTRHRRDAGCGAAHRWPVLPRGNRGVKTQHLNTHDGEGHPLMLRPTLASPRCWLRWPTRWT
jgi:hypothetical protein